MEESQIARFMTTIDAQFDTIHQIHKKSKMLYSIAEELNQQYSFLLYSRFENLNI